MEKKKKKKMGKEKEKGKRKQKTTKVKENNEGEIKKQKKILFTEILNSDAGSINEKLLHYNVNHGILLQKQDYKCTKPRSGGLRELTNYLKGQDHRPTMYIWGTLIEIVD